MGIAIADADVIVLKDGSTMQVFNLEKSSKSVMYTETADEDAPIKKIPLEKCFAIKIGEGELEPVGAPVASIPVVNVQPRESVAETSQKLTPTPENESLIASYSSGNYGFKQEMGKKEAKAAILFYKPVSTSLLSSEDIEISFQPGNSRAYNKWYSLTDIASKRNAGFCNLIEIKINISNKTDKLLYINLEQTTLNSPIFKYRSYYEGVQKTQSVGRSSGAAVGLGPVVIGGGNSNTQSVTKTEQAVLIIPPHSTVTLPPRTLFDEYNKEFYELYDKFSEISEVYSGTASVSPLKENEVRTFTEEGSQPVINFNLSYAYDREGLDERRMNVDFFICRAIGLKRIFNAMAGRYEDQLQRITNIDDKMLVGTVKLQR